MIPIKNTVCFMMIKLSVYVFNDLFLITVAILATQEEEVENY